MNIKSYFMLFFFIVSCTLLTPGQAQTQTAEETTYLPLVATSTQNPTPPTPGTSEYPVVFVSRQIPPEGSIYYSQGDMLPGVGHYSRFIVAAPGKLLVLEPDSTLRTLINGSNPRQASMNLIDVNAPDVSYDGTKIVFAGLPDGNYVSKPKADSLGAWRIYTINVDGTGLQQVTFSDQDNLDLSQFDPVNNFDKYDDTDPAWLPDGRIVFSSTRWPSLGMYNDARTTNLYIINADGSDLHRITAERNGADRSLVDPLTGKIVYSRWWRNFRNGANDMGTVTELDGYALHLGLVAESRSGEYGGGPDALLGRNAWQLATINPDGTELMQFAGVSGVGSDHFTNHAYGGSFAPDGSIYSNYLPMHHLAEAAGFGGIRHYPRGPNGYNPFLGITDNGGSMVRENPPSYQVFKSNYADSPEVLPDGNLIVSWAPDTDQDYGLYTINADGSDLTLLYDNPGTTELRSRIIRPRPLPPIIPDQVTEVASLLPPLAKGPYDVDGTFTYNALNVYFNAPVDSGIVDAIPVGSANTIRFYIDHQRTSYGFPERLDWPILLDELPVAPDGSIQTPVPANVPLFEQIRSALPEYNIPLSGSNFEGEKGAAHVAGLNFGRPGTVSTCVGCHAGHTMIPVPENPEDAQWTNLAPSATVTTSSSHPETDNNGRGLIDRRVNSGEGIERYWLSQPGESPTSQWVELTFPVQVTVRMVRLYNIPYATGFDIQVENATINLYSDETAKNKIASSSFEGLSSSGSEVYFNDVLVRTIHIELNSVSGNLAGLAEVEVIARGEIGP